MSTLPGTPYLLEDEDVFGDLSNLESRIELLRSAGSLQPETLRAHFGDTRFEQVAESNAIEGSPLTVNETQLAVLQGIAISGHDPAYSRDAINLSKALDKSVELARSATPTNIEQLTQIHDLILSGRPEAGAFRNVPIRISGSDHRPPKTWHQVMHAMEEWEDWSTQNTSVPPLIRAVVLHTWLTHIHPFFDGNGRAARAIMNLELVRNGYPSVIIRKKDRLRYYEGLALSDMGDLSGVSALIFQRASDAVLALERSAKQAQGYDVVRAQLSAKLAQAADIWNDAVRLLFSLSVQELQTAFGPAARGDGRWYEGALSIEDYERLIAGDPAGNSWAFSLALRSTTGESAEFLAWIGFRSASIRSALHGTPGPSIFWSQRATVGPHKWSKVTGRAPAAPELTLPVPNVDHWVAAQPSGTTRLYLPSELARLIASDIGRRLFD